MFLPMPNQSANPNPRKRPAPGAVPAAAAAAASLPQMQNTFPNGSGDQMLRWAADGSGLVDGIPGQGVNPYTMVPAAGAPYGQAMPAPSNALARRQMNRALVPTNPRPTFDPTSESWASFVGDDSSLLPPSANGNMAELDNVDELEELALKAKKEAQAKRKQIPPFVQKLSSFLDQKKNEDLIRWSDKGDSFIVLDEDEFAKTLIPELFKHNNYASFVRQLNMYGFHKRVGLSDNSMRASERKNKSPSEYSNQYFRRGHPNLLWLINKPKGTSKAKKGKNVDGDADSEDDVGVEEITSATQGLGSATANLGSRALPANENAPLQRKEITQLREELARVRDQQNKILTAIRGLQQNNQQLYQHALAFQSQHDRHQNSINAILNFLANVFRKTLEDQSNPQNINDLLSSVLPTAAAQVPQGSVVDLGDFLSQATAANPMAVPKRARGLLPAPGNASTVAPSPASTATTPGPFPSGIKHDPEMGYVTELFDTSPADATSPAHLVQDLEARPQESMMKFIHSTNANNTTDFNLPEVVNNTEATLSADQRNKMLSMMAGQNNIKHNPSMSTASNMPTPASTTGLSGSSRVQSVASSINMPPPPGNTPASVGSSSAAPLSLSPIIGSAPIPPSISQINMNQSELAALQRMQEEQSGHINQLQSILGPLSPSGRIPGLDDNGDPIGYFNEPPVDIDEFLNMDNLSGDGNFDLSGNVFSGTGNDFDFSLDGSGAGGGLGGGNANVNANIGANANAGFDSGRVVDADNSTVYDTPSPSGTEEIQRDDLGLEDTPDRNAKRRRMA